MPSNIVIGPRLVFSCGLIAALLGVWRVPGEVSALRAVGGEPQATEARAENLQVLVNGTVINVTYDLVYQNEQATFDVVLEASQDGGQTYDVHPVAVTGDVGPGIHPGIGRTITWQAARDT